jgi:hypothetical protein
MAGQDRLPPTSDFSSKDTEVLDFIPKIIEKITAILHKAGIILPSFVIQAFLLILTFILLFLLIQRIRKNRGTMETIGAAALGLIAVGILISWGEQILFPLPGEIDGYIKLVDRPRDIYTNIRVNVFDVQGNKISYNSDRVDSVGRFIVKYSTDFGVKPYVLRVEAPGCTSTDYPLTRPDIRRKSTGDIQFNCGGKL